MGFVVGIGDAVVVEESEELEGETFRRELPGDDCVIDRRARMVPEHFIIRRLDFVGVETEKHGDGVVRKWC